MGSFFEPFLWYQRTIGIWAHKIKGYIQHCLLWAKTCLIHRDCSGNYVGKNSPQGEDGWSSCIGMGKEKIVILVLHY